MDTYSFPSYEEDYAIYFLFCQKLGHQKSCYFFVIKAYFLLEFQPFFYTILFSFLKCVHISNNLISNLFDSKS